MFMNNADMDNFTLLAHCLFQKSSSIQTAKIVCNFMRNFARIHVRLLYMYLKHLSGLKITTCKISVNLWLSYFLRNFTETILWCLWWFSFHTNVEFTLNCLKWVLEGVEFSCTIIRFLKFQFWMRISLLT